MYFCFSGSPLPRESLTQLSDLLEKGEQSLFFTSSRMPANIEREIQEENLQFLQNRDVYSEDYYRSESQQYFLQVK